MSPAALLARLRRILGNRRLVLRTFRNADHLNYMARLQTVMPLSRLSL